MRPRNRSPLALICLTMACASTGSSLATPPAQEIPTLEAAYRASPDDALLRARLASAYRAGGRPADAVGLLEPGVPYADPVPAVTLAGAYEDMSRFDEARSIYMSVASSTTGSLQREVNGRLLALDREELKYRVRQSMAREAELRGTTPAPDALGVFPFLFSSTNEELRPLSTALAELLSVDLAQTDRLRVVERAQLQFLLDELRLAESGRVDTLTAARAGRLVGAGRIVQGRIGGAGQQVDLSGAVVSVGLPEAVADIGAAGPVSDLFDMEKQLAIDVYDALGIQLTAAEREAVNRRHTENLQALLAFGFGLEAADAGRYDEALAFFEEARTLDPGFTLADEWYTRTDADRIFQQQGGQGLVQIAAAGTTEDLPDWVRARDRFRDIERLVPDPQSRDAVTEVLGVEGLDRGVILEIIIRAPVGVRR